MRKYLNKKGFTLIELIVVIAVLAILAAIAGPRVTGALDSSRFGTDCANAKMVANALEQAHLAHVITLTHGQEVTIDDTDDTMNLLVNAGYLKKPPVLKFKKYDGDGFSATVQLDDDDVEEIIVTAGSTTLYNSSSPETEYAMPDNTN